MTAVVPVRCRLEPIIMSAGELEHEWAGTPGRLIRYELCTSKHIQTPKTSEYNRKYDSPQVHRPHPACVSSAGLHAQRIALVLQQR